MSGRHQDIMRLESQGTTMDGLNMQSLGNIVVPLPPLDEQRAILNFSVSTARVVQELADVAQRAIDLLQERRTALISAAVTGQIDVRPESMRTAA